MVLGHLTDTFRMDRKKVWYNDSSLTLEQSPRTQKMIRSQRKPMSASGPGSRTGSPREEIRLPSVKFDFEPESSAVDPSPGPLGASEQSQGVSSLPTEMPKSRCSKTKVFQGTCQFCDKQFVFASLVNHEKYCEEIVQLRETKELKRSSKDSKDSKKARKKTSSPQMDSIPRHVLPLMSELTIKDDLYTKRPFSRNLCEHCGIISNGHFATRHKPWCSLQWKQVRSNSQQPRDNSELSEMPKEGEDVQGNIVARVVTVGLVPGKYDEVLIRSAGERPKTRTLPYSSLHQTVFALPTIEKSASGESCLADRKSTSYLKCKRCGKVVERDKLAIHSRLCKNSDFNLGTGIVKFPSALSLLRVQNQSQPQPQMPSRKPDLELCYICGREYGSNSISIHEPQCLRKFNSLNAKLPIHERLPLPKRKKSSGVARVLLREDTVVSSFPGEVRNVDPQEDLVQDFFDHCYSEFERDLVPCKKCGRTFAPERHIKHEPNCNAKPLRLL